MTIPEKNLHYLSHLPPDVLKAIDAVGQVAQAISYQEDRSLKLVKLHRESRRGVEEAVLLSTTTHWDHTYRHVDWLESLQAIGMEWAKVYSTPIFGPMPLLEWRLNLNNEGRIIYWDISRHDGKLYEFEFYGYYLNLYVGDRYTDHYLIIQ